MRPVSPEDIFTVPPSMEELMTSLGRTIPYIPVIPRARLDERPDGLVPEPRVTVTQPSEEPEAALPASGRPPEPAVEAATDALKTVDVNQLQRISN